MAALGYFAFCAKEKCMRLMTKEMQRADSRTQPSLITSTSIVHFKFQRILLCQKLIAPQNADAYAMR